MRSGFCDLAVRRRNCLKARLLKLELQEFKLQLFIIGNENLRHERTGA